jgi:prepilin-type N-terminal cleavage/methylation domain-containing protein
MRNSKGYTFVEIMVVVALLGILMTGVIGLFLTNLKISNRATALARVKQEGDYSSSTIERLVRYAKTIDSTCPPIDTSFITFDSSNTITVTSGQLMLATKSLTSSAVSVTAPIFNCVVTPGGKLVIVSYTITDAAVSSVSETFTTRVVLRNKE